MKLYLIPTPIADNAIEINGGVIALLDCFVVENIRTARRYISSLKLGKPIESLTFIELSEHTSPQEVDTILADIIAHGGDCGVMSEAGLPCVADPGNLIVGAAHRANIEVVPLVGASSLMLALMASGASGQNFAFNGYLPIKADARAKAIKFFERRAFTEHQSQIFIETPYRNRSLFDDLTKQCAGTTMLTVAVDLLAKNQSIQTMPISKWKAHKTPDIEKRPAIFIIF